MVNALSQEEWLDRYDLIEDDWYTNPSVGAEGSTAEDGDIQDVHNEL